MKLQGRNGLNRTYTRLKRPHGRDSPDNRTGFCCIDYQCPRQPFDVSIGTPSMTWYYTSCAHSDSLWSPRNAIMLCRALPYLKFKIEVRRSANRQWKTLPFSVWASELLLPPAPLPHYLSRCGRRSVSFCSFQRQRAQNSGRPLQQGGKHQCQQAERLFHFPSSCASSLFALIALACSILNRLVIPRSERISFNLRICFEGLSMPSKTLDHTLRTPHATTRACDLP